MRSPHAHALIRAIDRARRLAAPGVAALFTIEDLRPHLVTERLAVGLPSPAYRQQRDRPVLAGPEVVHVGEPIAIVVADCRARAEDAAALVAIDYDVLPAVSDCRDALAAGAPVRPSRRRTQSAGRVHHGVWRRGARLRPGAAPFRRRDLVRPRRRPFDRGRGAVAFEDALDRRLDAWSSTQTPHAARQLLCDLLGRPGSQCARWRRPTSAAASDRSLCSIPKMRRFRSPPSCCAGRSKVDPGPARAFRRHDARARPILGR